MPRFAVVTVVCLLMAGLSPSTRAQTPTATVTQKSFSFCTVDDSAGHMIWATPVFEYEHPSADNFSRTLEMATDFHAFIGSKGGTGDKTCAFASNDRATAEAARNEQRSILTSRFMGLVAINKWQDVAWTPKPWTPALAAKPAVVRKYFYCYGTDTDQRKTLASSVASEVFEMSMDGADPMTPYALAERYGKQFDRNVIEVHGLTRANSSCYFKDTHAEAEKSLRDYRKNFSGYKMPFTDVAWQPIGGATATSSVTAPTTATGSETPAPTPVTPASAPAPARIGVRVTDVTPEVALGLGMDKARGALVIEVFQGSPAIAAGLKPMDIVLEINGQPLDKSTDLPMISSRLPAGKAVTLRVWRERALQDVLIDIAGSPAAATQ
ncbi:MAG: PDZ domain-containing protein [Thermomonas sp.]